MSTITGIDEYSNVHATAPDDGSQIMASHTRHAVQVALNNTRYLYLRSMDGLEGGSYDIDLEITGTLSAPNDFTAGVAVIQDLTAVNEAAFLAGIEVAGTTAVEDIDSSGGIGVLEDVTTTEGDFKFSTPRAFTRVAAAIPRVHDATWWIQSSVVNDQYWISQVDITTGLTGSEWADYEVVGIPDGATITGASVLIDPAAAHADLPATKPQILLAYQDVTGTAGFQTIASQTDAPANVGAYEAAHTLSITGQSFAYDAAIHKVVVRVRGEFGANAEDELKVRPPRVSFTITKLSP
jgi:hypothetical protein